MELLSNYKGKMIESARGRDLMLAVATDVNKTTMVRKVKKVNSIILMNATYDIIMHGRVVAVYGTMKPYENFGIIDIDINDFNKAKEAAQDVFIAMRESGFFSDVSIQYTGKEGFHVYCNFPRRIKIDTIKYLLQNQINKE